ncbi:MAG: AzlC family ABC transporter permease [Firmicutes bacterium]|nr:AzlC family ABC transporter permease [Bacillota bacterium]
MSTEKNLKLFKQGFTDGIPIGLGYFSVGFTFGLQAVAFGLPLWAPVLISMTNVTSAGQFAGLSIICALGTLVEMALAQLIINMRYALMSLSLSQKFDDTVRLVDRFLIAFVNTDEVFAVAAGRPGTVGRLYMFGLITAPYFGWALGTLLGAGVGDFLPQSLASALGIAIYGMFLAIIIPPAKQNHAIVVAIAVAVGLSCLFNWLPLLQNIGSGFVIIICTVVAAAVAALLFPVKEVAADAD